MKASIVKFLLLFSLLFHISHASIIAMEDDCNHDSVHEYIMEQTQASECGDLCDMHHLFHLIAIISTSPIYFDVSMPQAKLTESTTFYTPPFQKKTTKPPIT